MSSIVSIRQQSAIKDNAKEKKSGKSPFSKKFLGHYVSADATDENKTDQTTPTAIHNLKIFSEMHFWNGADKPVLSQRNKLRVLFDGFSTPFNVIAMQKFATEHLKIDPSAVEISAIDLGTEAMEEGSRLALKNSINFSFQKADARSLPFSEGFFSIVFHDFLLNCAPLAMHRPILSETARVLDPIDGILLLGWTSVEGHLKRIPRLNILDFEPGESFKVSDLSLRFRSQIRDFCRRFGMLLIETRQGFVLVTPNADFEFFRPAKDVGTMVEQNGLTIIEKRLDVGLDRFENVCFRHRLIATLNPEKLAMAPGIKIGDSR